MNLRILLGVGKLFLVAALYGAVIANASGAADEWISRASADGVEGRANHTAVWTGSEMIVWGGEGSGYYSTGARFNARSNTWTVVSSVSAPANRSLHGAIWTGSEMIIWGGRNSVFLQSGARYNPVTDTWLPTSTVNAPSARTPGLAVWTGTEMIIWGGNTGTATGNGALYNPTTDSWRPMSSTGAPAARDGVMYVWTGTELIVWGGHNLSSVLNDGARYNPATDTWQAMSSVNAPSARTWNFSHVWTGTEMIIWGGANFALTTTLGDGARYNPTTDTWTPISSAGAPSARNRATLAWTGQEMIVFGGATGAGTGTYVNTGARYNPDTDTWAAITTSDAPNPVVQHTAIWTGASMLVYGGYNGASHSTGCRSYSPSFNFATITAEWLGEYFGADYRHNPSALENADADKDGSSNVKEFQAETNPVDPFSGFASSIRMTPSITWSSVPGVTYRILRKATLDAPAWEVIDESFVATDAESVYYDRDAPATKAFYLVEAVVECSGS